MPVNFIKFSISFCSVCPSSAICPRCRAPLGYSAVCQDVLVQWGLKGLSGPRPPLSNCGTPKLLVSCPACSGVCFAALRGVSAHLAGLGAGPCAGFCTAGAAHGALRAVTWTGMLHQRSLASRSPVMWLNTVGFLVK